MHVLPLILASAALAGLAACSTPIASGDAPLGESPGSGPHPAVMEQVASLPGYVVYRPRNLAQVGDRGLGVYLFGNGGCSADGAHARKHLLEVASHGYIAIAPGGIHSGPGATPLPERQGRDLGQGFTPDTPLDAHRRALEWVMAENARPGSTLFGRIHPGQIASSGYSCGGLQALEGARDPRVKTVVMMFSGLFPEGSQALGGLGPKKEELNRFAGSYLYVLGGEKDIAYANGMDDFARIGKSPAVVVNLPVGHGGTFDQANGGHAARITVDWLNWQLRGDARSAAQFRGTDCRLCGEPGVQIARKNID